MRLFSTFIALIAVVAIVQFSENTAEAAPQSDLIVDCSPQGSGANAATAADFVANDSGLDPATPVDTVTGGQTEGVGNWAGVEFAFGDLTLTTGGGRTDNARNGNAAGYPSDLPILGGSVLTNGADDALTLDIAGLATLPSGTPVVLTLYGIGDNVGQDTVFESTFGATVESLETVYNTNPLDREDDTGAVPFVQFSYVTDGATDTVAIVLSPSEAEADEPANPRSFLNGFSVSVDASVLKGDVNLSGDVTFLDIAPFIMLLANNGFQAEADVDCNGMVTFLDIAPFIQILSGS